MLNIIMMVRKFIFNLIIILCFILKDVTIDNVDQYVKLSLEFIFRDGIRRQMDAFRSKKIFFREYLFD